MLHRRALALAAASALVIAGCASKPRQLMPTPLVYQQPGGDAVITTPAENLSSSTDINLLYITDRGKNSDPALDLPYGEERARRLAFGNVRVEIGPNVSWQELNRESRLAKRTRDLDLSLGEVTEIDAFPKEPYALRVAENGHRFRQTETVNEHYAALKTLQDEVAYRLTASPRKEVMLYVHGFNETFESAAFTAAELCHFLGREPICSFFTWPASSTGNFLISYTSTTESADYAVSHLKKTIRALATTPGVERVQLLAHSRGTALTLNAIGDLFREAIAAGKEPVDVYKIENLVFFSPDIDIDVASQQLTAYASDPDLITVWPEGRLPESLKGPFTVYSSPNDRALLVSRILFRSQERVGNLRADDIPLPVQDYLAQLGDIDVIVYEGKRTDAFGHSYFTTNPQVSSDVVQLLRYGKRPGEPGRPLKQVGPVVWKFPKSGD
jgi:esterase/lipase superfamily enzyme